MTLRALCLHTELLHDDGVWRRLQLALDELEKSGRQITFLVYPLRAVAAGRNISERVRELTLRGHEVGQHTHFYVGLVTERPHKITDLSDRNVRECIARDYDWLRACGATPSGFCAGNFMMTETAYETLAELEFVYDCSSRLPWERSNYEAPQPWLDSAQVRVFGERKLVLLPNTEYLTLPQLLHPTRRRRKAQLGNGGGAYQLLMNHDYDLLHGKVWYAFLGQLRRKHDMRTVGQLAQLCLGKGDGR